MSEKAFLIIAVVDPRASIGVEILWENVGRNSFYQEI